MSYKEKEKSLELLKRLCIIGLKNKGVHKDKRYLRRLKEELLAVELQGEAGYFLELKKKFQKENLIFPYNEHNLLIAWLLDLAPDFDIEKEYAFVWGEFPDVDIDYIRPVRDYLKRQWAPSRYGQEKVCEIGTYGTAGIKSSIIGMARVYGLDIHEIQRITKYMHDKDNEGNELSWDDALKKYKDFRKYCEEHPEVAQAAKLFQGRITHAGVHAGGLIISNKRIDGFVPLEVRLVNKENPYGVVCSAWTEGLAHQDLQPVGLIKFDLLVINNLMQIADACRLVKERHGIKSICAKPGDYDWSDTSYLNDEKALALADKGDLKGIFQFDGDGIQELVRKGGVSSFDDLVAYTALYRPGCLKVGMDEEYCKRKRRVEKENWEMDDLHPVLRNILKETYGVICYQEQVLSILREVGGISYTVAEKVRKAISKKKYSEFAAYKDMFIENGARVLGSKCLAEQWWRNIESWAEYGFNKSHACAYTYISSRLLYLKAHYPLEFYTAILMNEQDHDKYHEYISDARKHGIEVERADINKSDVSFSIVDDKIYFGFRNIKGIGESAAKRIVANQPYRSFKDFLDKFGFDLGVVRILIAIGAFQSIEPGRSVVELRKFYEAYRKYCDEKKRKTLAFTKAKKKVSDELKILIKELGITDKRKMSFSKQAMELWKEYEDVYKDVEYNYRGQKRTRKVSYYKLYCNLYKKLARSYENYKKWLEKSREPTLDDPSSYEHISVPKKEFEEYGYGVKMKDGRVCYLNIDRKYYCYNWCHELELSKDYHPNHTIKHFMNLWRANNSLSGPIEVMIISKDERTGKNKQKYYLLLVEDANYIRKRMVVWNNIHERYKDILKVGNLISVRVKYSKDYGMFEVVPTQYEKSPQQNEKQNEKQNKKPNKKPNNRRLAEDDASILCLRPPERVEVIL